MIKTLAAILASMVLVLTSMLSVVTQEKALPSFGSVAISNDYFATTTSAVFLAPTINYLTATSTTGAEPCCQRSGTFGSIIQTTAGSAGGNINVYDATTTSALKRAQATSTLLIASLPTNATVGTYTYDVQFKNGLLVITDGTVGTTTITWR